MARILSQQEIDSILQGKRQAAMDEAHAPKRSVIPWNVREAGQMGKDQARIISGIHEGFARNLGNTLGAYLRVVFDVRLVSVQQLTFDEFLVLLPERPYLMSYDLHPHNAVGSLQMDQSLIFPIVDLLLGGPGRGQSLDREISDIEEEIIESVARIICKELQSAWQPFGLDLQMSERQSVAQLERQFPPTDKVLALSFEVGLAEAKGSLNLVFPSSLCNTILRQASKNWAFRRARGDADSGERLKQKLLSCKYDAELSLSNLEVRVKDVLALKAGSILRLPLAAKQPAALEIESRSVFEAYPVRVSNKRAAQLGETIQVKTNLRKVK